MRRICLCLLIAFASASVAAREVRLLSAEDSCPEANATSHKPSKQKVVPTRESAPPARETRARPSLHSDSEPSGLGKPRWHSFLPGMFR
jgi:hypothetical protein